MQDELWTRLRAKKQCSIVCYANGCTCRASVWVLFLFRSCVGGTGGVSGLLYCCMMGMQKHAKHPAGRIQIPYLSRYHGYGSVLRESVRRRKWIGRVLRWLTGVDKAKEGGWTTEIHFPANPVIYSPSGAVLSPTPTDQRKAVRTAPVRPHPPVHPLLRATSYTNAVDFLCTVSRMELKNTIEVRDYLTKWCCCC